MKHASEAESELLVISHYGTTVVKFISRSKTEVITRVNSQSTPRSFLKFLGLYYFFLLNFFKERKLKVTKIFVHARDCSKHVHRHYAIKPCN